MCNRMMVFEGLGGFGGGIVEWNGMGLGVVLDGDGEPGGLGSWWGGSEGETV